MANTVCLITHLLPNYSVLVSRYYAWRVGREIFYFSPSFREEEIHINQTRYNE